MEGVRVFHWTSALAGFLMVMLVNYNQRLVNYSSSGIVIASEFTVQNKSVGRTLVNNVSYRSKTKLRKSSTYRPKSSLTITTPKDLNKYKCKKRLPSAIVIGIQKCGTSALCTFLREHPQIVCAKGEAKYFSSHYDNGLEWYRNYMPCSTPDQITIEKSPPYFYRDYVPTRIKLLNPDMKLIVIVKDPIVRSQSMFSMQYRNGEGDYEREVTDSRGEIDTSSTNINYSTYAMHMKPWLQTFPLDQFIFIDGHNLEIHPDVELRKVEKFLKISSYFVPEKFWFNETKGKPCMVKRNKDGCLGDSKGREHPTMSNKLREKMEKYFRPLNEKFFEMIHKHFDWGY